MQLFQKYICNNVGDDLDWIHDSAPVSITVLLVRGQRWKMGARVPN